MTNCTKYTKVYKKLLRFLVTPNELLIKSAPSLFQKMQSSAVAV